jgi:hypothetical protein
MTAVEALTMKMLQETMRMFHEHRQLQVTSSLPGVGQGPWGAVMLFSLFSKPCTFPISQTLALQKLGCRKCEAVQKVCQLPLCLGLCFF